MGAIDLASLSRALAMGIGKDCVTPRCRDSHGRQLDKHGGTALTTDSGALALPIVLMNNLNNPVDILAIDATARTRR